MSIALAKEAWSNYIEAEGMKSVIYALFPDPPSADLTFFAIWAWEQAPVPDQPYAVTTFYVEDGYARLVGSTAYTLDLRGALAETIDRIKGLTI